MTLKEAIESRRPFRHKSFMHHAWYSAGDIDTVNITMECAISDDWEIHEKQTFSRKDVERAIDFVLAGVRRNNDHALKREAMKAAESGD